MGELEGISLGTLEGGSDLEGALEIDGGLLLFVGGADGFIEREGTSEGISLCMSDGFSDTDGNKEGVALGVNEGIVEGLEDGRLEGILDMDG